MRIHFRYKYRIKLSACLFFLILNIYNISAQAAVDDTKSSIFYPTLSYGFKTPIGSLSDRFGIGTQLGFGIEYLNSRNIIFGSEFQFYFGSNVKEDVLAAYRLENNLILGTNNEANSVFLRERGTYFGFTVGKVFASGNSKSGWRISLTPGIWTYKIRFIDPEQSVPQIRGEYSKGYDRYTTGLSLKQFLGYQYHGKDKKLNFYAGFDITEGLMQVRRPYNFPSQENDKATELQMQIGFKVGFILPFYIGGSDDEVIFY